MRICYLAPIKSVHSQKIFQFFKDSGHDVQVITFEDNENKEPYIHNIPDKNSFLSKLSSVRKIVDKISPDILHAHQVIGYGMWGALSKYHPLVISPWGSDIEVLAKVSYFNKSIAKYVLRKADKVHVSSDCMAKTVMELGCPKGKIFKKVMGVDIKSFHPSASSTKIRQEIGGSHMVISIRTLTDTYRVDILIKAVPDIVKKYPNARFVIIGDGDRRKMLEKLSKEKNVSENILFFGRKNREEIPAYLATSDLYVDTCPTSAGISIGMLEAMACSLPMIIVSTPGVDEAIENGVSGLICPQNNPKELSHMIIQQLSNESKMKQMGIAARKRVEEIGDMNQNFTELSKMYESLLKD